MSSKPFLPWNSYKTIEGEKWYSLILRATPQLRLDNSVKDYTRISTIEQDLRLHSLFNSPETLDEIKYNIQTTLGTILQIIKTEQIKTKHWAEIYEVLIKWDDNEEITLYTTENEIWRYTVEA